MNKTIVAVIAVVVLLGLGVWYSKQSPEALPAEAPATAPVEQPAPTPEALPAEPAAQPESAAPVTPSSTRVNTETNLEVTTEPVRGATVSYSGSSFSPSTLSLKVGDMVSFINNGGSGIRVSSNPHPAHSEHSDFDSGLLGPKASWTYTFKTVGTYGFHNHLNPGAAGTITVK